MCRSDVTSLLHGTATVGYTSCVGCVSGTRVSTRPYAAFVVLNGFLSQRISVALRYKLSESELIWAKNLMTIEPVAMAVTDVV